MKKKTDIKKKKGSINEADKRATWPPKRGEFRSHSVLNVFSPLEALSLKQSGSHTWKGCLIKKSVVGFEKNLSKVQNVAKEK